MRKGSKKSDRDDYIDKLKGMSKEELRAEARRKMSVGSTVPLDIASDFFNPAGNSDALDKAHQLMKDDPVLKSYAVAISSSAASVFGLKIDEVTPAMTTLSAHLIALMLDAYGEEPQQ